MIEIHDIAAQHTDVSDRYDCYATITRVFFRVGSVVVEAVRLFRADNMPSADVKIELWTSVPFAEPNVAPDFWRYVDPRAPRGRIDRAIVEAIEIAAGLRLPPDPRPIELT